MTVRRQIKIGLRGYSKAWNLIFKREFAKFLLFPLLLNVVILWFGTSYIFDLAEFSSNFLIDKIALQGADFWGAELLRGAVAGVVSVFMYILFFIIFLYVGGNIIITILSPLFSIVSEKTENYLTIGGNIDSPFDLKQVLQDMARGIMLSIRNLLFETFIILIIFIISFIPVIGWIVGFFGAFFMFFVSSYFFGFSYMDFANERQQRNVKESLRYIKKYKWVAITNGSFFVIALTIPYCGIALSAFVAILSAMAGTVSMLELNRYESS